MKFLGKRLELEKIIMSELTQRQKKKVTCSLSLEAPCSKSSNEYITQNNCKHQESQKGPLWISPLERFIYLLSERHSRWL